MVREGSTKVISVRLPWDLYLHLETRRRMKKLTMNDYLLKALTKYTEFKPLL